MNGELELLATGRDADVFALDDERVLRHYRYGGDVAAEVAIMRHVRAHDYPVPEVFRAEGPDVELTRLSGPTMLDVLLSGEMSDVEAAEILADLLWRLHDLPPMSTSDRAERVLHLDLHPDNVILTPDDGPIVIDWRNARHGEPAFDLAMTALILAQVGLAGEHVIADGAISLMYAFRDRVGRALLPGLPAAKAMRAANPTMSAAELACLDAAVDLIGGRR